jgi:hypothetical protein
LTSALGSGAAELGGAGECLIKVGILKFYPKKPGYFTLTNIVKNATIYIVKKGTKSMPPISKSGFLLGALLAAAAAVVKIVVLDEIDRRAGRTVS